MLHREYIIQYMSFEIVLHVNFYPAVHVYSSLYLSTVRDESIDKKSLIVK